MPFSFSMLSSNVTIIVSYVVSIFYNINVLCCHPFTDKAFVLVYKFNNTVVVFGVLIANATTLQNFQCFERHFYRFYPFAVYAGRKYKAVGLEVVFVGIHAMVHGCSLFQKINTLSNTRTWIVPSVKAIPKNLPLSSWKRCSFSNALCFCFSIRSRSIRSVFFRTRRSCSAFKSAGQT